MSRSFAGRRPMRGHRWAGVLAAALAIGSVPAAAEPARRPAPPAVTRFGVTPVVGRQTEARA